MKSVTKKMQFIIVAVFILSATTVMPNIGSSTIENEISMADDLIGAWNYTVENVAYEYSKGVIKIGEENGAYTVEIQLVNGSLNGEDVTVNGNTINFSLFIEGQTITVVLTSEGDSISGESNSMDGVFKIEGSRILPE